MICSYQTGRSGHILHNDARIPGNVFSHLTPDGPRIGVEPASGTEADDNPDGLSLVEGLRGIDPCSAQDSHSCTCQNSSSPQSWHHNLLSYNCLKPSRLTENLSRL